MTNAPQSPWAKMRTILPEPTKKFEYLAHKTVEDKKSSKNFDQLNVPVPQSHILSSKYIGKKREIKNKFNEEKKNNKEIESKKILYCFNCAWKFPERMSIIRRSTHINRCYEGYGKLDIMQYNEEQKLKLYRNYPNKKISDLVICPICGKDMGGENNKSKQNHLHFCSNLSLVK